MASAQKGKGMNNKIRYKSMKRSSPNAQYKRFLLGKHYQNRRADTMPIPGTIHRMISEQWKSYASAWAKVESVKIGRSGSILERVQHEID